MNDLYKPLINKLTESERILITSLFWDTARKIIVDIAPKELSDNQLKRYVYEKMYSEPAPSDLWNS